MSAAFNRYVGIDYSGAQTCTSSLKNLRVYSADPLHCPMEVAPPRSVRKYWTRKAIAEWLVDRFSETALTLVGIDHGFSFPADYFEKYGLPHDWTVFLNDFQEHWPTDNESTYVDFVREGICGNAVARCGDSRWRRITEVRAGAKSMFHFDVPGSVAKSTHAGIPWLDSGSSLNVCPSKGRYWTDCLFPLVASRLDKLIRALLPQRCFASVASTDGHEPIAALACAITALAAAAGQCVAVGASTDGYIVLPPISFWGSSAEGERWAERELRKIVCRLSWDKVGVHSPKIYCGADLLDLRGN